MELTQEERSILSILRSNGGGASREKFSNMTDEELYSVCQRLEQIKFIEVFPEEGEIIHRVSILWDGERYLGEHPEL